MGKLTALETLDFEIASAEMMIEGLKRARSIIAGVDDDEDERPVKRLSAPRHKPAKKKRAGRRRESDGGGAGRTELGQLFEVNGHEIPCTEQQYAVVELLAAAPEGEMVAGADILAIFDNKAWLRAAAIKDLNGKLAAAAARVKGGKHGFRLENTEG